MSRIAVVPLFLLFLATPNRLLNTIACLLFIFASVTDIIDGYLARRTNNTSQMGKLLDPLADKLLIITVLILLLHLDRVHFIFVVILIGREIAVNSLRGIATEEGVVIAASQLAKHKTTIQVIALVGLILGPENQLFQVNWYAIGHLFLWAATILSIVSGYQYFTSYHVGKMEKKEQLNESK